VLHRLDSLFEAAQQALRLILDRAVSINPWWMAAGVVLYELAQVIRSRGWFNILRSAYPGTSELRARDATGAYLAGVGLNSVLPAHGGDFLKVFMVHRRMRGATYPTLIATFLPETLFESLLGGALVVWALAHGFLPVPVAPNDLPELDISFIIVHPLISAVGAAVLGTAALFIVRWIRRRARGVVARLRQGLAILRSPRDFLSGVVSWQALGRLVRLGGLACFMAAFQLPVTVDTVVLVMAAQGAGRIIPLAPVSAGLRVAMLAYGFPAVTDRPVDIASITSFWFALGAVHLIASVVIGLVVVSFTFRTLSPRRAVASIRAGSREPDPVLITPLPSTAGDA
jgi:hypothetical protein